MHSLSLLEIGMIGFLAQMVGGALGMGYGVTSSSLLISMGIFPAIASASIHMAEIFVSFFSGISHFKLGNTRKDLLLPLISFGIIGGIIGTCGLVKLPSQPSRFVVAFMLLAIGCIILFRFLFRYEKTNAKIKFYSANKLRILGCFAAFVDAIAGGGWGPICTPTLIINGTEPNKAIGSVNLAKFFVTLAISLTFLVLMGFEKFRWDIVFALLIGGIIAAPLAAYSCNKLPRRILGILIGLIVMLLSLRIFQR